MPKLRDCTGGGKCESVHFSLSGLSGGGRAETMPLRGGPVSFLYPFQTSYTRNRREREGTKETRQERAKPCKHWGKRLFSRPFGMAPLAGFEPATAGLEIRCSIQLSYRGKDLLLRYLPHTFPQIPADFVHGLHTSQHQTAAINGKRMTQAAHGRNIRQTTSIVNGKSQQLHITRLSLPTQGFAG
jgi:hypothetical protein